MPLAAARLSVPADNHRGISDPSADYAKRNPPSPSGRTHCRLVTVRGSPRERPDHLIDSRCGTSADRDRDAIFISGDGAPRSSIDNSTEAIAPCPIVRLTSLLRLQMILAASSRLSAPATHAAATSPMLWPTTAFGSTPHERHRAANAIWIANSAGWITSTSFNRRQSPHRSR